MGVSAPPRAWVIVPIYNAAEAVSRCLDALGRTLDRADTVWLADDASPDPRIAELVQAFARQFGGTVEYQRQSHNLGFVGNVNAAMQAIGRHDAVLLNSDTEPHGDWLRQLEACAAREPQIATATPWSNNAEICSFPEFCRPSPMPTVADGARIAAAAATLGEAPLPELPTAVGFAMWIRRAAWEQLGGFDQATFGRGYGEENDFCRRAAAHGWRNVLCPTAYVAHQGNVSFAPLGQRPGGENLRRLLTRYPDYNRQVADFIAADPLLPLRAQLSAALS